MIPLHLLVHTCTLKKRTGVDRNRNPTYTDTVLTHVRIEATLQTVRQDIGETKTDTMTLFIDPEHTQYSTIVNGETSAAQVLPEELDAVEWQGRSFTVRSVKPCYSQGNAPHHWEYTLE